MEETSLQLTKYQYHDFMMLLQSLEYMTRAAQFRKYKAEANLENLPHYRGKARELWKFATNAVYQEDVARRHNNWSWDHMENHLKICKTYRDLYKTKLTTQPSKLSEAFKKDIEEHERYLDEVNIRIQRQLAEREVDKKIQAEKEKAEKNKVPFKYYVIKRGRC